MSNAPTPLAPSIPGALAIGSLAQARRHKRQYGAVITLEDPGRRPGEGLRFWRKPAPPHLVLSFEDVDDDHLGIQVATHDQVAQALAFARDQRAGSILIHCLHGVGRSAGVALAILADREGVGSEGQALEQLLSLRPEATPNRVVIKLADNLLERDGALVAAVDQWEARTPDIQALRVVRREFVTANPSLYRLRTDLT